jgi:hypothetical protein
MTIFSASTTKKNSSPPPSSQGHTCNGTGAVSKMRRSGGR